MRLILLAEEESRSELIQSAVLWMAALVVLVIVAFLVVRRFREDAAEDQPGASDLISKFRELHSQGELNDEEYRTIKTRLAQQLHEEMKKAPSEAKRDSTQT